MFSFPPLSICGIVPQQLQTSCFYTKNNTLSDFLFNSYFILLEQTKILRFPVHWCSSETHETFA